MAAVTGDQLHRLMRYVTVIGRAALVAAAVFGLTAMTGAYLISSLPTIYVATAEIELEPNTSSAPGAGGNTGAGGAFDPNAEIEIMRSPLVLEPVVQDLGLDRTWAMHVFKVSPSQFPPAEALAYLNKILKIQLRSGTLRVDIAARSETAEEAAAIANAVVDSYKMKRDLEEIEVEQSDDPDKKAIRGEIAGLEQGIDEKKPALQKLREKLEAGGARSTQPDVDMDAYRDLSRDLEKQQGQLDDLNRQLKQVNLEGTVRHSPVRVIARAQPPLYAAWPNRRIDMIVTYVIATLLAIGFSSTVEMACLILRASERPES